MTRLSLPSTLPTMLLCFWTTAHATPPTGLQRTRDALKERSRQARQTDLASNSRQLEWTALEGRQRQLRAEAARIRREGAALKAELYSLMRQQARIQNDSAAANDFNRRVGRFRSRMDSFKRLRSSHAKRAAQWQNDVARWNGRFPQDKDQRKGKLIQLDGTKPKVSPVPSTTTPSSQERVDKLVESGKQKKRRMQLRDVKRKLTRQEEDQADLEEEIRQLELDLNSGRVKVYSNEREMRIDRDRGRLSPGERYLIRPGARKQINELRERKRKLDAETEKTRRRRELLQDETK